MVLKLDADQFVFDLVVDDYHFVRAAGPWDVGLAFTESVQNQFG